MAVFGADHVIDYTREDFMHQKYDLILRRALTPKGMLVLSSGDSPGRFLGAVSPVIDRTYPLSETAGAVRYVETGRARGKVVISIMA